MMILALADSCPLTRLAGGLSKLYSADDDADAVALLTNYDGPWRMHATITTPLALVMLAMMIMMHTTTVVS